MAKQNTVTYKFGLDTLRGKLATKQKPILYTGQTEGEPVVNAGDGLRQATNFDKYMVLTVRRGKNMFYIKSRTTVNNSRVSMTSRTLFAVASSFANSVYLAVKAAYEIGAPQALQIYDAYMAYKKTGQTLREWLSSIIVQQVAVKAENIMYYTAPDAEGLSIAEVLVANPFTSATFDRTNADMTFGVDDVVVFDAANAKVVRSFLRSFARFTGEVIKTITINTDFGRVLSLDYASTDGSMTAAAYTNGIQNGQPIEIEVVEGNVGMGIYVQNLGLVWGRLYRDSTFETELASSDDWNTYKTWYFKTGVE